MQDDEKQNKLDESILAADETIERLDDIQYFIFNFADYLYTAAWVWFGLTALLFIAAIIVKG